jgi:hypothetical protein
LAAGTIIIFQKKIIENFGFLRKTGAFLFFLGISWGFLRLQSKALQKPKIKYFGILKCNGSFTENELWRKEITS